VSEYVVDAAAVVQALSGKGAVGKELRIRLAAAICHAPHLIDAEVGNALRGGVRRGEVDEEQAHTALRGLGRLVEHRYPHTTPLMESAWQLRHTISFYDGLYVALATMLALPLLTADVKLTKAPGLTCRYELIS